MLSTTSSSLPVCRLAGLLLLILVSVAEAEVRLPDCHKIPKVLCCTDRVIEKCLTGCVDYITSKCPHKLELSEKKNKLVEGTVPVLLDSEAVAHRQFVQLSEKEQRQSVISKFEANDDEDVRRAPQTGDYAALNPAYPVTEVSDKDLTTECGVAQSRPPYSPCLSRKSVDDLFFSCCQQHVPASCHSLCSFEHREHVAAELLIAAVTQEGCDLAHVSKILYCANQNRDNRPCCEYLGLAEGDLGVGDRCLRLCNVGGSGDKIGSVAKEDLVCLSNWNVVMYCARAGLRTIN